MVFIVTGGLNSGKTTRILDLFKEKNGGGVASLKSKEKGYDYYNLVFLGSFQPPVLLATENPEYSNKEGFFKFKRFHFNSMAFKMASVYITQLITLNISPIFLDEVGKLEFNSMGFHDVCLKLMELKRDVYIAVRDTNISEFLRIFKPAEYKILENEE